MVAEWVVGVLLSVAAAVFASLGDNLVKFSFKKHKHLTSEELPPLYKRKWFVLGNFCMIALNPALTMASYAFADASLLLPLTGLHIVLNLPLAKYMNDENSSMRAIGFNGIIMLGVFVVLLTSNKEESEFTAMELFHNFFDLLFIFATIILAGIVAFLYSLVKSPKISRQRAGYTVLTGIVGSVTQVFAKSMTLCLKDGAWGNLFTWFCVVMTIVLALSQVYMLNQCLDRFSATYVVPIVNATIIIVGSIYAGIFFQEMDHWSITTSLFVPFGIFLTSLGIALLSFEPDPELGMMDLEDADVEQGEVGATSLNENSVLLEPISSTACSSSVAADQNSKDNSYIRMDDI